MIITTGNACIVGLVFLIIFTLIVLNIGKCEDKLTTLVYSIFCVASFIAGVTLFVIGAFR